MYKLFQVVCWYNTSSRVNTFSVYVIASNEQEATEIVKNHGYFINTMGIKEVNIIQLDSPRLLGSATDS